MGGGVGVEVEEKRVKNANLRLVLQPHKLISQGLEFHFQLSYTFQLE